MGGQHCLPAGYAYDQGCFSVSAAGADPRNLDTDGDLIPDGWEVYYGFDPLANDADADPDDDDLSNALECQHGADPNPDTDGDGLSDGWEVSIGTDPATLIPMVTAYQMGLNTRIGTMATTR